eukprot:TRINITY_DN3892_c0_g1_i7.p1 TRINITY_DN3892_c0_g1~~TRINITY_DN3892_c0_g1_i7.p1  ORF type:complete len:622 (+),score=121.07 TRINITY_DN3892_c0_g1_i7:70-1935(+)
MSHALLPKVHAWAKSVIESDATTDNLIHHTLSEIAFNAQSLVEDEVITTITSSSKRSRLETADDGKCLIDCSPRENKQKRENKDDGYHSTQCGSERRTKYDYPIKNLARVLDIVVSRDFRLLDNDDFLWLNRFCNELSSSAQLLYLRLYVRKPKWFRFSSLMANTTSQHASQPTTQASLHSSQSQESSWYEIIDRRRSAAMNEDTSSQFSSSMQDSDKKGDENIDDMLSQMEWCRYEGVGDLSIVTRELQEKAFAFIASTAAFEESHLGAQSQSLLEWNLCNWEDYLSCLTLPLFGDIWTKAKSIVVNQSLGQKPKTRKAFTEWFLSMISAESSIDSFSFRKMIVDVAGPAVSLEELPFFKVVTKAMSLYGVGTSQGPKDVMTSLLLHDLGIIKYFPYSMSPNSAFENKEQFDGYLGSLQYYEQFERYLSLGNLESATLVAKSVYEDAKESFGNLRLHLIDFKRDTSISLTSRALEATKGFSICIDESLSQNARGSTSGNLSLFHQRFRKEWIYSRIIHKALSLFEKQRNYTLAIQMLELLLASGHYPSKRGDWWVRLSVDYEHLGKKFVERSLQVCENALCDSWVRSGERSYLQKKVLRLTKYPLRIKVVGLSCIHENQY